MASRKSMEKKAEGVVGKIPFPVRLIAFIIISAALLVSLIWQSDINKALGLTSVQSTEYEGMSTVQALGTGNDLNIHFVDVGQGDACVIELPDGKNMLIDSGSSDKNDALIHYIEKNIKDDDGTAIDYFDIVILTHSDEDHCGEMADVLKRFPAKVFYRPNQEATRDGFTDPGKSELYGSYSGKATVAYAKAIEAGYAGFASDKTAKKIVTDSTKDDQNVIKPEGVESGSEGYYEINFYSPLSAAYDNKNDYSPILVLEYNGNRVALSGDAEAQAESEFVDKAKTKQGKYSVFTDEFTVQAIKLGHHGSRTSSSEDYLEIMTTAASRPDVKVVISCGIDNSYGHPHPEVLTRLEKMGFKSENILRTDENSDIVMSIKFDEGESKYLLFFGADVVRTKQNLSIGGVVDVTWQEIVMTLIAVAAIVLLILPFFAQTQKQTSRATKTQTKGKSKR